MNRCNNFLITGILLLGAPLALAPLPAMAQSEDAKPELRQFPKTAVRGVLMVLAAPDIAMDGKPDRLSPAVRIRDSNNALVLSGTLAGQKLAVNYTRDNIGLVQQVWLLSADESRQKMPGEDRGGILGTIRSLFESKPASDDGKTAYDQLPRYKSP